MTTDLQTITATNIDLFKTVAEAAQMKEVAEAMAIFYEAQGDTERAQICKEVSVRSARKGGKLLVDTPKEHGGDRKSRQARTSLDLTKYQEALEQAGITPFVSQTWQKLAQIPDKRVDEYFIEPKFAFTEFSIFSLLKYGTQIIGDSTGNEWYTPERYINSVKAVLGAIDLDPASCLEANATVGAKKIYTESDDGLEHRWHGRVFMNPPYADNKPFAVKMIEEYTAGNITEAIVLLGAHAIETHWFAAYWDYVLCFTGHRIKFNTPTGPAVAGNIAGSVFVHLGPDSHKFAAEFGQHGYVVRRWPQ